MGICAATVQHEKVLLQLPADKLRLTGVLSHRKTFGSERARFCTHIMKKQICTQVLNDLLRRDKHNMESKFNGGLLGLIGVNLVQFLITLITLGIGAPWAVCFKERWIASHTVLDGKQLTFDGTGGQLFGTYIKWMLLTIITIGIYSFWLNINMKKWVVKHTHFKA